MHPGANWLIKNVRLLLPDRIQAESSVLICNGQIDQICANQVHPKSPPSNLNILDGQGALLTPGLIDLHTHGIENYLYEASPSDLLSGMQAQSKYGVTSILPTIYRLFSKDKLHKISGLAATLKANHHYSPGFHFEGPFLALPGAGAETVPGDIVLLKEIIAAADGTLKAMSISPDTKNIIPIIETLKDYEISVFMTHTQATTTQTQTAIQAGAHHATHFYNVFYPPEETEPGVRPVGIVEEILADKDTTVDFICDGTHVHSSAIKAAIAAKSTEQVALITDSNIGAGLDEGIYEIPAWNMTIQTRHNNAARIHAPNTKQHGSLAGSTLTMNKGMQNLFKWIDLPESQIWQMGTSTPANIIQMKNKGRIVVGADADLVLWNPDHHNLQPDFTWLQGKLTYHSDSQSYLIQQNTNKITQ
ncbi:amidohydrolase family protein [Poriferisphaera sp. WC338]|uniref:amidohydrolase family protein n=1 Tax=Poriferisphaera sp. WC338 TaxID=3425129 RepID=UPI003D8132BF